jgi:hypothetical protein
MITRGLGEVIICDEHLSTSPILRLARELT